MDLPIITAATIGLAVFTMADGMDRAKLQSKAEGAAALVGEHLYATEDPIARWGAPIRAEDLALEDLGQVADVVTGPTGEPQGLVVSVGGIWGFGAQDVELGMNRIHLVRAQGGETRLVVDLSARGAEPALDGIES
ncbi:PRC-barrel domain-containing protein [Rubellimicrobium arenae]|uniref:PRC-barrel domain-containing protein n=1 Tax=Rubellimicrobium arenae TaxID=2817372 RepID=UPI001B316645|nr:PRC-barrel domain-containing protein [Rubellimicrobium arenae]